MKAISPAFIGILYSLLSESAAFAPSTLRAKGQIGSAIGKGHKFRSAALYAKSSDGRRSRFSDTQESRTCIRNFLTQRSIQSFMFLLKEMRDPHTNDWIEDLLGANNLLSYHGSGALNLENFPVWDSVFTEMISREPDVVHVEIRSKVQGRQSKDKPFGEYEAPQAGAWTGKDYLKNIKSTNTAGDSPSSELRGPGVRSYADSMSGGGVVQKYIPPPPKAPLVGNDYLSSMTPVKAEPEHSKIEAKDEAPQLQSKPEPAEEQKSITIEIDIDPPSLANRLLTVRSKIGQEWASDLELMLSVNEKIIPSYNARKKEAREREERSVKMDADDFNAEEDRDIKSIEPGAESSGGFNFGRRSVQTFERGTVYLVNNHPSFNNPLSTPLRSSSFDLLFLLSTQEAIHRLLASYKDEGEEKAVSRAWLKKFYVDNLDTYFDGCQSFGRADDFIDDLLIKPPALKTIGKKLGFIDPLAIAEDIIDFRGIVAKEWREAMINVAEDHEPIRKEIFVHQISKWGGFNIMDSKQSETAETETSGCGGNIIEGGDFE